MGRKRRSLMVLAVTAALTSSLAAPASTAQPLPVSVFAAAGLSQPVQITVDRWGVPHLYAANTGDLFQAQGFNAARERLFQLDLWLRKGTGRLAEAFGPSFTEQDRASRLFLYRGDMAREWQSYGPEGKLAATRFAAGVNAYLDWLDRNPATLPEEFRLLGHKPARWSPEDVVRIRAHALSRNLTSEVDRSRVTCAAGIAADRVRTRLQPSHEPVVPAGFDPCSLPAGVLNVFNLATGAVAFQGGQVRALPAEPGTTPGGSNNWVVSPGRTTTGRPILANDPHREIPAPGQRYVAHLSAPGIDVIGAGEPSAPGLSIGHNQTAGFGLTIAGIDQEDLYVYQLDPANHGRYRYGDGWEDIRTVTEQIPVAGAAPKSATLSFTRHGPVIAVDPERNLAYGVRAAWLDAGMSPYLGSLKYLRAKNFTEFQTAVQGWGAPTLNHVYADTAGNIGWAVAGRAPRRVGYDGLLPVPGDGRYDWDGFVAGADLPRAYNPPEGFIATANEYNLPEAYPVDERPLGYEWNNPARHDRIVEVLTSKPKTSVADSVALQSDQVSLPARRLVKLLEPLSTTDPAAARALELLRGWDAVEHADSAQATLFETWLLRHLGPAFVYSVLPQSAAARIPVPDHTVLVGAMENPVPWFGADGARIRDQLLLRSLTSAFGDVTTRLGADPAQWKWGALHRTVFRHPAGPVLDAATRARLDVGPMPAGGSWYTVDASFFYPGEFEQRIGGPFRMVLDVGAWDESRMINAPGQSGVPSSPHYRDQAEKWRTGEHVPLLYSRSAVEANAGQRIILLPA